MELASLNSDMAMACEIKHDDKLTDEDGVYIQASLRIFLHPLKLFIYLQLLGINPLPLKSGSTSLHLLLWAEKTKNMQYVLER